MYSTFNNLLSHKTALQDYEFKEINVKLKFKNKIFKAVWKEILLIYEKIS